MAAKKTAVAEKPRVTPAQWLRNAEVLDVALAVLPFLAVTLPYIRFVPIWDGRIYADCIRNAATHAPTLANFICADHPTLSFSVWLSLFASFSPDSPAPIALGNIAFGVAGLAAFHRIARTFAPQPERRLEVGLLTAAAGLTPQVAASVAHPSPDFAVWTFALLTLSVLLRARLAWTAAFGTCLVLSKESGLLVFSLFAAAYLVAFVTRADVPMKEKGARLVRHWPLLIPFAAYALFTLVRPAATAGTVTATVNAGVMRQFISFSFLDNVWPAALACIFVLNFAWVPASVIGLRFLLQLGRFVLARPAASPPSARDAFLIACFVLLALALTRFRTYLNVRYFLPVAPLLLLVAWRGLGDQAARLRLRTAALALFCVLQLVSVFRTVDPLAIAAFKSFDFGEHRILDMTSMTHECCGKGRDQIAYNMQFVELARLTDRALPELAQSRLPIASDTLADWYLLGSVEPGTGARTLAPTGVNAAFLTLQTLRPEQAPPELWFLAYPNFADTELNQFLRAYVSVETKRFEDSGYVLVAHRLRRR